jgi:hypothetical protein
MITITDHAIERYVERVMGMGEDVELNNIQTKAVREKITEIMKPYMGAICSLGEGRFNIDGAIYVVDCHRVVTIKIYNKAKDLINPTSREVRGGRMRSGAKVKKRETISKWDRRQKEDDARENTK